MPLLSKNLFHHNAQSAGGESDPTGSGQHTPPLLKRSSKSFLSFMSRKPSIDSIKSDKSVESSYVMNPATHPAGSHNVSSIDSGHSSPRDHHHQQHAHHQLHPGHQLPHGGHGHPQQQQQNHPGNELHSNISPKPSHSMSELKRFFRSSKKSVANLHLLTTTNTSATNASSTQQQQQQQHHPHQHHGDHPPTDHHPYSTTTLNLNAHYMNPNDHKSHTQSAIPPSTDSVLSLSNTINIYHDDTILAQKYGRLGKMLGSGAGGSVKVLVRPTDGATFAVKEFRPRKSSESIKQYAKKCTAEFCIGSSLHHPNVVQTIDIFSDFNQNKYFQVMEYLPVDFFAVVMTGLMSRGEINCCFKQIAQGVRYLHSMGLAHRDLKLDNCCMNGNGILKLIDFGSAVVFRYPFENTITMAHGIVGSDPYLAPEVITSTKSYDPECVDIWSMGIIFCCMMLKRFPWKAPKLTDDNFKLYSMPDDFPHDYSQSAKHHEHLLKERREKREGVPADVGHRPPTAVTQQGVNKIPTPPKDAVEPKEDGDFVKNEEDQEEQEQEENDNDDNDSTKSTDKDKTKAPAKETKTTVTPATTQSVIDQQPRGNVIPKVQAPPAHQGDNQDEKSIVSTKTQVTKTSSHPQSGKPHHHKKVIHGPYRLLRLLPHASRPILSKILDLDPQKRATMIDIFDDEWFDDISYCTIDMKNNTVRAPGHHHTIVKDDKTYKV